MALVYFLSLQSTYGQSFAFPHKSKLRNALLHSRSLGRFIVKVAGKEKDSIEPIDSSDSIRDRVVLHNNPPLSYLPYSSHEGFQR